MSNDIRLYLDRLRDDFPFFIEQLWIIMGWDKKAPIGDPERSIASFVATGPDECGVLAPRGIGKTHIVTISLTLWEWYRNPDARVLVVSKSAEHAREVVQFCRRCLNTVPFLKHLRPRPGSKDAGHAFTIGAAPDNKQPSIRAIGIDGQLEGNRAHIIIADDVETDDNALTVQSRIKLAERVNEFGAILYKPEESTSIRRRIVYVGTYHHEYDSLYLKLSGRGVTFRTWPLCYPQPNERVLNLAPELDRPELAGQCVFGHRLGNDYLARERARGRRYWSMQLMLLLPGKDGTLARLNLSDLIVMDVDPKLGPPHVVWGEQDSTGSTAIESIPTLGLGDERLHRPAFIPPDRIPYTRTIAFVDPAGSGADELAYAVVSPLGGLFHVKAVRGILVASEHAGNVHSAIKSATADILRLGATEIFYESNIDPFNTFGSAIQSLAPGVRVTPVHAAGARKHARLFRILQDLFSQRRVVVDRRSLIPDDKPPEYQLQFQISRLTDERDCLTHDDRVDALASALSCLGRELEPDEDAPHNALEAHHTREIERINAELDRLHGRSRPKPRFMDRKPRGR